MPANRGAAGLREVRVQLKWRHQFQFAGFYAAIAKGYYRDAGLDVKLIEYSPGVTPIDQLIGGRVDFAVADSGALIYRATGVPLVALAALFQHSPSILLCLASSDIQTLADLRGKRLMFSGGYMNAELMAMLKTAGIRPDDFTMIPADTSVQVLLDGKVDAYNAYITNEPDILRRRGIPYRIFQPRDYGVDFYGDLLITTESKIAEDPKLVRAFRAATLKGWAYAAEHPAEVVDMILAKYNTQHKTRAHLLYEAHEAIKLILSDVVPIGYMNEQRWQRIEDIFLAQGVVKQRVDLAKFIYRPDDTALVWRTVARHGREIGVAVVLLVVGLLLAHIAHLKTRIAASTRALREAKQRAEEEARSDVLTGLANRRHFIEVMDHDLAQATRREMPLSMLLIDIDFFKRVNDAHGHAAGDEALRRVADVLRSGVRSSDVVARIGGEEFAVGCPSSPLEETRRLAERLRRTLEAAEIRFQDASFRITVSIGLALRGADESLDDLLHHADRALYEAKKGGRNRVCEYVRPAIGADSEA